MLYDSILLIAVFIPATALLLPVTGGEAIASGNWWYSAYLLFICYIYFTLQWKSGRQTLGMRAWHMHLAADNHANPGWRQVSLRFFLALLSLAFFGLGFFYALADRRGRTMHDILSGTHITVHIQDQ
jgi:uncharacterized RDD family membrane protein YckC